MLEYGLMLIVLSPGGTYMSGSKSFATKEACEVARVSLAARGTEQTRDLWILSDCARGQDRVVFRSFSGIPIGAPPPSHTPKETM